MMTDKLPRFHDSCICCGTSLAGRNRHAKVCSGRCHSKLHRAREREHSPKKETGCRYCGTWVRRSLRGRRKVCAGPCERRRAQAWQNFFARRPLVKACVVCGSSFMSNIRGRGAVTCSERCRKLHGWRRDTIKLKADPVRLAKKREHNRAWYLRNRYRFAAKPAGRACVVCGATFFAVGGSVLCSELCRKQRKKDQQAKRQKAPHPPHLRICPSCGFFALGRYRKLCKHCSVANKQEGRRKVRITMKAALAAAFELGLIDRQAMTKRARRTTIRALRELGLVPDGRRRESYDAR